MTRDPVLECISCASGYDKAIVIRDVSISVETGGIFGVVGKNGMGKTTLLKTIMGFLKPVEGKIRYRGEDITAVAPQKLAGRGISYVPQENAIFQDMSVEDNLRLAVGHDRELKGGLERIANYFPVITQRLKQKAGTLSGGEQKMLLMSRALISRPSLMLVDEISEGLQPTMVERMAEALRKLNEDEGTSILLVEQNISFISSICDRVALIKIGSIAEERAIGSHVGVQDELLEMMRI